MFPCGLVVVSSEELVASSPASLEVGGTQTGLSDYIQVRELGSVSAAEIPATGSSSIKALFLASISPPLS